MLHPLTSQLSRVESVVQQVDPAEVQQWDVDGVATWLGASGLDDVAPIFRRNNVRIALSPDLI
jgi:hypothetical protein